MTDSDRTDKSARRAAGPSRRRPSADDSRRHAKNDDVALLEQVVWFADLATSRLTEVASGASKRNYARDDVMWKAGDQAETLAVVLSGELDVWGRDADGSEIVVSRLTRGETVGEMGLVLDGRRSATVSCRRPARVLFVGKDVFQELMRESPRMLEEMIKQLSRRLVATTHHHPVRTAPVVVGIAADPRARRAPAIAQAIAEIAQELLPGDSLLVRVGSNGTPTRSLIEGHMSSDAISSKRRHAAVLRLSMAEADDVIGMDSSGNGAPSIQGSQPGSQSDREHLDNGPRRSLTGPSASAMNEDVSSLVEALVEQFGHKFLMILLDFTAMPALTPALGANCERIVQVTHDASIDPLAVGDALHVIDLPAASTAPIPLNSCEPFVLLRDPALEGKAKNLRPDRGTPSARVLGRLTRKLLNSAVGIALGGGGAFGMAHIGVLKVLEAAGIPIDLVAGTSAGSIAGLLYASGLSPDDLTELAVRLGNVRVGLSLLDPSLSGTGIFRGKRVGSVFGPMIPAATFNDLELPCRTVATDIHTGGRVDIGDGSVVAAMRASCAIPLVFSPVRRGEEVLVDGGMVDPVPVDVVREMGADVVIGVNVVPRLERGVTTGLSRVVTRATRLNPLAYLGESRGMPDMFGVFMNSIQAAWYELGNYKSVGADALINVDMAEYTWIDIHRADRIAVRGQRAAQRAVPEIQQAIQSRLAVAMPTQN